MVQRTKTEIRFTLDFDKRRAGGGVSNAWSLVGEGASGDRYFVTPEECDGTAMKSGITPVGTHAHRDLCFHIPAPLRDKPFVLHGIINYRAHTTGWIVPTMLPPLFVPFL